MFIWTPYDVEQKRPARPRGVLCLELATVGGGGVTGPQSAERKTWKPRGSDWAYSCKLMPAELK